MRASGEGTIFKRSDGKWIAMITVRESGRRLRKRKVCRTQRDALAAIPVLKSRWLEGFEVVADPDSKGVIPRFPRARSGSEKIYSYIPRQYLPRISTPTGVWVGHHPSESNVGGLERELSRRLAKTVRGFVEVSMGYGRADVATQECVWEVKRLKGWRGAVRQVLAYHVQLQIKPALGLFGAAHPDEVLALYLLLRDHNPSIDLWWYGPYGGWMHIRSRRDCRAMKDPVV